MAINEGTAVFRFHNTTHWTRVDIGLPWERDDPNRVNVFVSAEQGKAIDLVLCPKNYNHYEGDDYCNCQELSGLFDDPAITVEVFPPDSAWIISGPEESIWRLKKHEDDTE